MIPEYNLTLTMLFNNAADRNTWFEAIKTAIIAKKATLPAFKSIVGAKDDSLISEQVSENI
jgi:hypothetical protein